jgi:hypothetical protein
MVVEVIYLDAQRFKTQDCDNIAHLVLNSLKKEDESDDFLFEDDRQIVRLLVYKLEAKKDEEFETNQIIISFRKHNPNKQMLLDVKNEI